ncbi:MAG: methylmalonyl-CoA epimerase [Rhodothermales bacterium]|nr:methylmalonyl-CoA epimerase [Rhodothermales bacterium]
MRLEHVGIAVDDVEGMRCVLADVLGRTPYKAETVEAEGVRTLFLEAGGSKLELLEALGPESPIAGFLAKRGPGMHHLAFEVADLAAETERLRALDYQILGQPRPGADGKQIVFLHPRGTGRVLVELCQQARYGGASDPGVHPAGEITVASGELGDAIAHALTRHFAVVRTDSTPLVRVSGTSDAPTLTLDGWSLSVYQPGDMDSAGMPDVRIPASVWRGLPDPWGVLGDLVAARLRTAE